MSPGYVGLGDLLVHLCCHGAGRNFMSISTKQLLSTFICAFPTIEMLTSLTTTRKVYTCGGVCALSPGFVLLLLLLLCAIHVITDSFCNKYDTQKERITPLNREEDCVMVQGMTDIKSAKDF